MARKYKYGIIFIIISLFWWHVASISKVFEKKHFIEKEMRQPHIPFHISKGKYRYKDRNQTFHFDAYRVPCDATLSSQRISICDVPIKKIISVKYILAQYDDDNEWTAQPLLKELKYLDNGNREQIFVVSAEYLAKNSSDTHHIFLLFWCVMSYVMMLLRFLHIDNFEQRWNTAGLTVLGTIALLFYVI